MDKEHASYILRFFPRLLNEKEARARLHQSASLKLRVASNKVNLENSMYQKNLVSDDPQIIFKSKRLAGSNVFFHLLATVLPR